MEHDAPLRPIRRTAAIVAGSLLLCALWVLSRSEAFVEDVYARRLSPLLARVLSHAAGLVPWSIAEIVLAALVLIPMVWIALAVRRVVRRTRRLTNVLATALIRIPVLVVAVALGFYGCWGLNYARRPLADRLSWPPVDQPADDATNRRVVEELATFSRQLVEAGNVSYRAFAGTTDLERESARPAAAADLDVVLEGAFVRVQQRLGLEPAFARSRGPAKPIVTSAVMNHLQLGGFYFPWTGEANYNRLVPAAMLPHTVAHEKAHQRGIALEDEASFIGYLACALSEDPYVRYSGYLFAQRQLLAELAARDPGRARALVAARSKGVQRDVDFIRAFWLRYEGPASRASEAVNDTYLRAQGERRGVAAYAASRSLIVRFARKHGGIATADVR